MIKKGFFYILYRLIGCRIPKTSDISTGLCERIRSRLVRGYIDYCGVRVNIQRKATIARRVKIGDFSGVGERCIIQGNVEIGQHVMMGPDVTIYTQNHSFNRTDITMDQQGFSEEKPVIIEDDVWIGARVIILPGVIVRKGCIIGAGAVVAEEFPPYSVIVGNPARVVKCRKLPVYFK